REAREIRGRLPGKIALAVRVPEHHAWSLGRTHHPVDGHYGGRGRRHDAGRAHAAPTEPPELCPDATSAAGQRPYPRRLRALHRGRDQFGAVALLFFPPRFRHRERSEEHTSELQSLAYLVCR